MTSSIELLIEAAGRGGWQMFNLETSSLWHMAHPAGILHASHLQPEFGFMGFCQDSEADRLWDNPPMEDQGRVVESPRPANDIK